MLLHHLLVIGFYPAKLRIFFEKGEDIERKIAVFVFEMPFRRIRLILQPKTGMRAIPAATVN